MDTTSRLRIATKIHFALLRYLGEGIDVGAMLKTPSYATEVLHVCRGSRDLELCALADQFEAAPRVDVRVALKHAPVIDERAAPQDAAWARNTTGFGFTRPMLDAGIVTARATDGKAHWYEVRRWFAERTTR